MVIATTVGAGVFVSAGYMAQSMGPGPILLSWTTGAVIALAGTVAYAGVAQLIPRSGGEYRYLSELLHPALGYVAGWASLLVGFSAPVAVDAWAAASYAGTLFPSRPEPRLLAAALVVILTATHAVGLRSSKWTQDLLAIAKCVLLAGFITVGLSLGADRWPSWTPEQPGSGFPLWPFMTSLLYVAFAFSGWNTAAYAAGEFRDPRRDVPRALFAGCAVVAVTYLLVNWIFVANLTPAQARAALDSEAARITLGHLVTRDLLGESGGRAMSVLAIVVFLSAMSAMTFAGPRVYAEMARDGFLPRWLAGRADRAPAASVLLQGALALVLLFTHQLRQLLENLGGILTLFCALTAVGLLRAASRGAPVPRAQLGAAAFFVVASAWILWAGFRDSPGLLLWILGSAAAALAGYGTTVAVRRRA